MAGKKMSGVYVSWPKPTFALTVKTNKNFRTNFHAAMMYAHYELTSNELKKETIIYLKKLDAKHPFLDRIKDMDENRFTTIGKYMYILNHGADIPEDMMASLMPHLEKDNLGGNSIIGVSIACAKAAAKVLGIEKIGRASCRERVSSPV